MSGKTSFQKLFHTFSTGIIVLLIASCGNKPNDPLSDLFMGTWRTNAPRYHDCYIEVSDKLLIIGNKNDDATLYHIQSIKKEPEGPHEAYTIICDTIDGTEFLFGLYLEADTEGPVLKLKNKDDIIWKKASS